MPKARTIRLVEIAELLGVTKQRAHQIAGEPGFPVPVTEDVRGRVVGLARGPGVGEAVAPREALALALFRMCPGSLGILVAEMRSSESVESILGDP